VATQKMTVTLNTNDLIMKLESRLYEMELGNKKRIKDFTENLIRLNNESIAKLTEENAALTNGEYTGYRLTNIVIKTDELQRLISMLKLSKDEEIKVSQNSDIFQYL